MEYSKNLDRAFAAVSAFSPLSVLSLVIHSRVRVSVCNMPSDRNICSFKTNRPSANVTIDVLPSRRALCTNTKSHGCLSAAVTECVWVAPGGCSMSLFPLLPPDQGESATQHKLLISDRPTCAATQNWLLTYPTLFLWLIILVIINISRSSSILQKPCFSVLQLIFNYTVNIFLTWLFHICFRGSKRSHTLYSLKNNQVAFYVFCSIDTDIQKRNN